MTVRFLLVSACLALTACGQVVHHHGHRAPGNVVINVPSNAIRIREGYYMVPLPQPVQGCPAYRAHSTIGAAPQTIFFRAIDGRFVVIRPENCTTVVVAPAPGHVPPGLTGNPGRGPVVGANPPGQGVTPPGLTVDPGRGPVVGANPPGQGVTPPGLTVDPGRGPVVGANPPGQGDHVVIMPATPRGAPGVPGNASGSHVAGGAPLIVPGNNGQRGNGNAGGGNVGGGQGPASGSHVAGGAPVIVPGNNGQRGNGNAGSAPSCPATAAAGSGSPPRCR